LRHCPYSLPDFKTELSVYFPFPLSMERE
jgi:hypothetical protein